MKVTIEVENPPVALQRHQREIDLMQSERNDHYFRLRAAERCGISTIGELAWKKALLGTSDARLLRMLNKGPRQQRSLVLGSLRFPLPAVRIVSN